MGINAANYLEIQNGIWVVLDICLLAWFSYYIYAQMKELDKGSIKWSDTVHNWLHGGLPPPISAAVAIYVFTVGDAIGRGHIWAWRHFQNDGHASFQLTLWPMMLAATISIIGLLCKIRVFTIYRLGNIAWISSLILAVVLVFIGWITQFHLH